MTLARLVAVDLRQATRRLRGRSGLLVATALAAGTALLLAAEVWFLRVFLAALDRAALLAPDLAALLLARIVGAAAAVSLAMLLTSNLVAALGSFFRAEDLDLLLASPLDDRTILAQRLVRSSVPASLPVLCFLLPLVGTLAVHAGGDAADTARYLAIAGLGVALAVAAPSVAGCLATILLHRFVPARLASRLVLGSGLAAALAGVLALRLLRPERLAAPMSGLDLAAFVAALEIPGEAHSPSAWLARILVDGRPGAPGGVGEPLLHLALLALAVTVPGGIVARATWRRALARSREESLPDRQAPPLARSPSRFLPGAGRLTRTLLDRELRGFTRDPARWSQAALLAGLLAVYLSNLAVFRSPDPLTRLALLYVDLATIGFVLASVALRYAFPAISSEGAGIVLLRASPAPPGRILAVKLAVVALPSLLLGLGLAALTVAWLDIGPPLSGLVLLAAATMGIALPALGLGAGARFPRYDAADPAELAVSAAGIATMLVSLAVVGGCVVLACPPAHRLLLTIAGRPEPARWEVPAAAAGILLLGAVATIVPLRAGARALSRGD